MSDKATRATNPPINQRKGIPGFSTISSYRNIETEPDIKKIIPNKVVISNAIYVATRNSIIPITNFLLI